MLMFRSLNKCVLLNFLLAISKSQVECQTDDADSGSEGRHTIKSVIETEYGSVRGRVFNTTIGEFHQSFTNIPYAKPPVGALRFQPPQPPDSWEGIRDATTPVWFQNATKRCLQYLNWNDWYVKKIIGSEDCLYLTIIRHAGLELENTEEDRENNLGNANVLVLLSAGTFMYDFPSSNYRVAVKLCCSHTLFVFVRYRLGPFGFMTTGNDIMPANLGLKDQIAALKFVQRNIIKFGGDPNRVTFAGVSAGAASVHLHMMSKQSVGLFAKAISVSGSAMNPWAVSENAVEVTRRYAHSVKCSKPFTRGDAYPIPSNTEMLECLMKKSAIDIVKQHKNAYAFRNIPISALAPTVDDDFLQAPPHQMLRTGASRPVPWLVSYTAEEGIFPVAEWFDRDPWKTGLDEIWNKFAPFLLDFHDSMDPQLHKNLSKTIKDKYTNYKSDHSFVDSQADRQLLIKIVSDRLFISGIAESARMQARSGAVRERVWLYEFRYRGEFSLTRLLFTPEDIFPQYGAGHAEDFLVYINGFYNAKFNIPEDKRIRDMLTWLWISFITHTTPELEANDEDDKQIMPHVLQDIPPEPEYIEEISYTIINNHPIEPHAYSFNRSGFLGEKRFWRRIPTNDFY